MSFESRLARSLRAIWTRMAPRERLSLADLSTASVSRKNEYPVIVRVGNQNLTG